MADQATSELLAETTPTGESSQPHRTTHQLRRARKCISPNSEISPSDRDTVSRNKARSSIKSEASGPHRRASTISLQSTMPSSTTSATSGILSPRYTKKGRISKAKKGVRGAHSCGCGKVYSRAEHLRRHQQNHETHLPCHFPSCGKTFHRQDLLDRHLATKHNEQPSGTSRRGSDASQSSAYFAARSVSSSTNAIQPPIVPAAPSFVSELPVSVHESGSHLLQTSGDIQSPTTQGDAPYIKRETRRTTAPSPWISLELESHSSYPGRGTADYTSSGQASPFDFEYSTPWIGPIDPIYTHTTSFDHFGIPSISTHISSPRSIATAAHMGGWIPDMDQPAFPTSIASSPTSVASTALPPVVIHQSQNGVPYPLPFVGQRDKYGSLALEGLLEEQHLGISLSLKTKQHYVETYWKHFHPMFPVLHKPSYQAQTQCPLLSAAVMSIGAQYTDEQFSKADSRILHEKCLELITKYKTVLQSSTRIDYMQAIFLIEIFSHFKAKRASSQLSEIFVETYNQLWKQHGITLRSHLDSLATLQPHTNEETVRNQWTEWIQMHSIERLLTACYILESQQALLLVRHNTTPASFGLELYIPVSTLLWEVANPTRWGQMIRSTSVPVTDVYHTLDNMYNNDNHVPHYEPFQCALLTACHASSVVSQRQEMENAPYAVAPASHPIFEASNIAALEQFLCPQTNVLIMHHMVRLAAHSPLRALLAASGESWVFSQRLSTEALLAAAEFATLKTELRTWTETLQQPTLWPTSSGMRTDPHEALQRSLKIITLALSVDSINLFFGAELALYYSSLVLWASTFTAVGIAEAAGLKFEEDDTAEFAAQRALQNVRYFVQLAEEDINSPSICDGIPSAEQLDRWRLGVGAVLTWSAWVVGGTGTRSSAVGELMEGAVGVLERLGRRGWVGEWF